jgi:hypothetical protein
MAPPGAVESMLSSLSTDVAHANPISPSPVSSINKMTAAEAHIAAKQQAQRLTMQNQFLNQDSFIAVPQAKATTTAGSKVALPSEADLRKGANAECAALLSGLGSFSEAQTAAMAIARKEVITARNNNKKQNKAGKKKAAKAAMYSDRKVAKVEKRDTKKRRRDKGKDEVYR